MTFYIVQYYDKNHKNWKPWHKKVKPWPCSPFYLTFIEAKSDAMYIKKMYLEKVRIRKYRSFEGQVVNLD